MTLVGVYQRTSSGAGGRRHRDLPFSTIQSVETPNDDNTMMMSIPVTPLRSLTLNHKKNRSLNAENCKSGGNKMRVKRIRSPGKKALTHCLNILSGNHREKDNGRGVDDSFSATSLNSSLMGGSHFTGMTGKTKSSVSSRQFRDSDRLTIALCMLVLSPRTKRFEVLQLTIGPTWKKIRATTVGDLLEQVGEHVTDPALASYTYTGLTRPKRRAPSFTDLSASVVRSGCVLTDSEDSAPQVLVALPEGFVRSKTVRLAKKIVAHEDFQKSLNSQTSSSSNSAGIDRSVFRPKTNFSYESPPSRKTRPDAVSNSWVDSIVSDEAGSVPHSPIRSQRSFSPLTIGSLQSEDDLHRIHHVVTEEDESEHCDDQSELSSSPSASLLAQIREELDGEVDYQLPYPPEPDIASIQVVSVSSSPPKKQPTSRLDELRRKRDQKASAVRERVDRMGKFRLSSLSSIRRSASLDDSASCCSSLADASASSNLTPIEKLQGTVQQCIGRMRKTAADEAEEQHQQEKDPKPPQSRTGISFPRIPQRWSKRSRSSHEFAAELFALSEHTPTRRSKSSNALGDELYALSELTLSATPKHQLKPHGSEARKPLASLLVEASPALSTTSRDDQMWNQLQGMHPKSEDGALLTTGTRTLFSRDAVVNVDTDITCSSAPSLLAKPTPSLLAKSSSFDDETCDDASRLSAWSRSVVSCATNKVAQRSTAGSISSTSTRKRARYSIFVVYFALAAARYSLSLMGDVSETVDFAAMCQARRLEEEHRSIGLLGFFVTALCVAFLVKAQQALENDETFGLKRIRRTRRRKPFLRLAK